MDKALKLLVVDDAEPIRRLLQLWFEQLPNPGTAWQVRAAANGREALQEARAWQPDVLLLDVLMPGMSGYEVAGHIRGDAGRYGDPVICFMTAYGALGETRDKALGAGGDHYLTKPFDVSPDALQELLVGMAEARAGRAPRVA